MRRPVAFVLLGQGIGRDRREKIAAEAEDMGYRVNFESLADGVVVIGTLIGTAPSWVALELLEGGDPLERGTAWAIHEAVKLAKIARG